MREVRAVFCSKFKPADGIDVYSAVYLDGIPSEKESAPAVLPAAPVRQLGAGEPVTVDQQMLELVATTAARAKRLPHVEVDTTIRPGESELAALVRSVQSFRETHQPASRTRAASTEELANIKARQNASRKESVEVE